MEAAVANADVNAKDKDGWTAFVPAKWYTNAKIVSLLKKAGAKQPKTSGIFLEPFAGVGKS